MSSQGLFGSLPGGPCEAEQVEDGCLPEAAILASIALLYYTGVIDLTIVSLKYPLSNRISFGEIVKCLKILR